MVLMKRIFIVEDEKNLRDLLVSYLINAEYDVTTFDDGLAAKKAISEHPDLWLLDIYASRYEWICSDQRD